MTDFGEKLRRQRESRNLTLAEISESTKINRRYLEALERSDFDALPGGIFAKGYIRSYAESIGLDPESLLEDYRNERRARGEEDPSEDAKVAKEAAQAALSQLATSIDHRERSTRLLLPILAGCALLAIIVWVGFRYLGSGATQERAIDSASRPAAKQTVEPESDSTTPAVEPSPPIVEQAPEPEVEAAPPAIELSPTAAEPQEAAAIVPAVEAEATTERDVVPEPVAAVERVAAAPGLTIPDYGLGSGLANRELVGRSDSFREGDTVWFWTRVVGGGRGDSIRHVWLHEGEEVGVIGLQIGGAHWRTQSRRQMRQGSAGSWSVEARDAGGRLLAKSEFTCLPLD